MYRLPVLLAFVALTSACGGDLDFGPSVPPIDSSTEPLATSTEPQSTPDPQSAPANDPAPSPLVCTELSYALTLADAATLDGQTLPLGATQRLRIVLDDNPTTGYAWTLKTNTLGTPVTDEFTTGNPAMGSGGTHTYAWDGGPPGDHTIILERKRAWEATAIATVSFVVRVGTDCAAKAALPVPCEALVFSHTSAAPLDGATLNVASTQDFSVELEGNATTGYQWSVLSAATELGVATDVYTPSTGMGSGGVHAFSFAPAALTPGATYSLVFQWKRVWETTPLTTVSLTIAARATLPMTCLQP